jgi:hypothetical protein
MVKKNRFAHGITIVAMLAFVVLGLASGTTPDTYSSGSSYSGSSGSSSGSSSSSITSWIVTVRGVPSGTPYPSPVEETYVCQASSRASAIQIAEGLYKSAHPNFVVTSSSASQQ